MNANVHAHARPQAKAGSHTRTGRLAALLMALALALTGLGLSPQAAWAETYNEPTGDTVKVSHIEVTSIKDGTGPWDNDDAQGNDSGNNNRRVRSYDSITYALSYTTDVATPGDHYQNGWIYLTAEIEADPSEATFDTHALEQSTDAKHPAPAVTTSTNAEGKTVQTLSWYVHLPTTKNDQGDDVYPFPAIRNTDVVLNVLGAKNGREIQPTFTCSVAYEEDGQVRTSGTYDAPQSTTAEKVTVTAAPKYNVQLKHSNYGEDFNYTVRTWDFATGNERALYKDAGNVYGRLFTLGVTLQLYNDNPSKGLRGIELPSGPITFDLDLSATYAPDSGQPTSVAAAAPLIWSYGPQSTRATKQDGREVAPYVSANYAFYEAPTNEESTVTWRENNAGAAAPATGTFACWDGGTWTMQVDENNKSKVHVKVADYKINPNWFPNGDAGQAASNVSTYYNLADASNKYIGCFSAGQLFLVVPYGAEVPADGTITYAKSADDASYYPTQHGSGTVIPRVVDSNFSATGETGTQVNTQTGPKQGSPNPSNETQDDTWSRGMPLFQPGSATNIVLYQHIDYYNDRPTWRGVDKTFSTSEDGSDVAVKGQEVMVRWGTLVDPQGTANGPSAQNALLKFDPAGLEFTGEVKALSVNSDNLNPAPGSVAFLYGYKKDGSIWQSQEEMAQATEQDLDFFATEQEGKTCVAVLAEARDYPIQGFREALYFAAKFKVKDDDGVEGKTYGITSGAYLWTEAQAKAVKDANGGNFPSRADGVAYAIADEQTDHYNTYKDSAAFRKAYYDDEGFHPENGNHNTGDTLYVVGYTTRITKDVEQGQAGVRQYQTHNGYTTVDYVLRPDFNLPEGVSFDGMTTTLTVTDTLPAGLTYMNGSAFVGGTYQANSSNPMFHGSIEGGTAKEPKSVTYNDDGTTTLVWEFEDTAIAKTTANDYIHFSASIDQEADGGDYTNTATVETTEDKRIKSTANQNVATATVNVVSSGGLVTTKQTNPANRPFADPDNDLAFTLRWNNTGEDTYNVVMMDTLPANEVRNSKFSGTTNVKEIKVTPPQDKSLDDVRVFYTTSEAASAQRASDYNVSDFDGIEVGASKDIGEVSWTRGTIMQTGSVADAAGKPITAIVVLCEIDKQNQLVMDVTLATKDDKSKDVFENMVSSANFSTTRTVTIAERVLEGKVWVDENLDGSSLDGGEPPMSGVRVELLRQENGTYKPVLDDNKQPVFALTDENGNYRFENLAAGTYSVRFMKGSEEGGDAGTPLDKYAATTVEKAGVPENYNSKASPSRGTAAAAGSYAQIYGIYMPEAKDIKSSPYEVKYQDLGVYELLDIPATKVWDDKDNKDEKRPDSVTVRLFQTVDGTRTDTGKTAKIEKPEGEAANEWKLDPAFTGLPQLDANGNKITYSLGEDGQANLRALGYRVDLDAADAEGGYKVTNAYIFPPTGSDKESWGFKGEEQNGTPEFEKGTGEIPSEGAYSFTDHDEDNPLKKTVEGQGTYTLDPDTGKVTFTPDDDFVGDATPVTVKVTDENGLTATGKYTPHVLDNEETDTVKRTINYIYATNGEEAADSVTQSATFKREATGIDEATHEPIWGAWQLVETDETPNTLKNDTESPEIEGWTPSSDVVEGYPELTHGTAVQDVTVVYRPTNPTGDEKKTFGPKGEQQSSTLEFTVTTEKVEDKETPNTISRMEFLDPETGEPIEGTTLTIEGEGTYTLDPESGKITFDPEPDFVGQATRVTVRAYDDLAGPEGTTFADGFYTPTVVDNTQTGTVAKTVNHVYDDGTPVVGDDGEPVVSTQELTFTRTGTVNPENGEVTWNAWEEQTFDDVDALDKPGYSASKAKSTGESVTPDDGDKSDTIIYKQKTYTVIYENGDHGKSDGKGNQTGVPYNGDVTGGNTVTPDEHYKFTGTYTYVITKDDGTTEEGSTDDPTTVKVTGNVVFTPVYEPIPWVTYVDPDGTIYVEKTDYDKDDKEVPEPHPTKEGYTFDGWDRDEDENRNVTYTARWKKVEEPAKDPEKEDGGNTPSNTPNTQNPPAKSSPAPGAGGKGEIPRTGDTANPALWLTLLVLSGVGLAGAYRLRRKEER